MENLRITNGFDKMPDATLLARVNQILTDMQQNFATAPGLVPLTSPKTILKVRWPVHRKAAPTTKRLKGRDVMS